LKSEKSGNQKEHSRPVYCKVTGCNRKVNNLVVITHFPVTYHGEILVTGCNRM
jgi:hypothetical protein